jgi:hypothetical protein
VLGPFLFVIYIIAAKEIPEINNILRKEDGNKLELEITEVEKYLGNNDCEEWNIFGIC